MTVKVLKDKAFKSTVKKICKIDSITQTIEQDFIHSVSPMVMTKIKEIQKLSHDLFDEVTA